MRSKWQAVWPLLWLALQRDDLAETTVLAEQLLVHSQQLPDPSCARYSSRQYETTAWTRAEPAVCYDRPPDWPTWPDTCRGYGSIMASTG